MFDVKTINNNIVLDAVANQKLKEFHDFQIQVAEMKQLEGEIKESLLKVMEEHGIKKFENEFVSITYVPSSTRLTADTKKMKEDNIFEEYCKSSVVKPSVRITFNGD